MTLAIYQNNNGSIGYSLGITCRSGVDRGRPNVREEKQPNAVLLIAASLIAAVRLNREDIKPSLAVQSKIADSIRLAEMIQARLRG